MADLIDPFGRRVEYLRVSVTDRCNYRCVYCMPASGTRFGKRSELLSHEEITRLVRLFSQLGVRKIRLTGGEPLVRRDLVSLVKMIRSLPEVGELSLSSNGHLLERFALPLREAGIARVNISLDSLNPETFSRLTRCGELASVVRGIDAALAAGMRPVKINMVVMNGINDQEIEAMLEFALERNAELRYIETMPVGESGADAMARYYPAKAILRRVREKSAARLIPVKGSQGAGPARLYQVGAGPQRIGVISAISRHFCDGCNRVRLTARGDLVLCLGREDRVCLRGALRDGRTDNEVCDLIRQAIMRKPRSHVFRENGAGGPGRQMVGLGG